MVGAVRATDIAPMNLNAIIVLSWSTAWMLLVMGGVLVLGSCSASPGRPTPTLQPAVTTNLRCEYLTDPLGIDQVKPRLSWIIQSQRRGEKQTAYQVLVATTPEALQRDQGDLWDSGQVQSDHSINVEYAGRPLQSGMVCHWKVRIWDKDGRPSVWSEPATWSMGLLEQDAWKAKWIELDPAIADPAFALVNLDAGKWIWCGTGEIADTCCFRRVVDLGARPVKTAVMVMFGEDEFTLWVNGQEAAAGVKSLHPTVVDIVKFLGPGRNLLAVKAFTKKAKHENAGLIANFTATSDDGESTTVFSDETWRASASESQGWHDTAFDDAHWDWARITGEFIFGDQTRRWEWDRPAAPATYLRKQFVARQAIARATAHVSGLGWFELHVNGHKVGDHVLDPVVSDYNKRAFYVTFDLTDLLGQGENAIGAILGLGRYSNMQLRLQVDVQYADGTSDQWLSDGTWKATNRGPINSNSEFDGESYDARTEMAGWDQPGFDDSAWRSAGTGHAPKIAMTAQMVEPIRVVQTIQPVAMNNPAPGVFVFDMGQNMVGWCRLQVSGRAGTAVRLRHAETLQSDGQIYVANLRAAKATDVYTLKGVGLESYEPRLTYHGFRYVEVTGFPGTPDLSTIQGKVVGDDLALSGAFECSNPLLNQIHQNIFWGVRGNYNGMPTDCPQRNERLGWLGDRGGECWGEPYLFNIAALYAKWLGDMRDTQTPDGSISDTAPGNLHNDGVVWPSTYLIACNMLYQQYGNLRCVSDHYDAMKKWTDSMSGFLADGIMPKNTYGDWCVPPESPTLIHSNDPQRQTDGSLLSTAYFYHDLRLMSRSAGLLGKQDDARDFAARAEVVKAAFNRRFLDTATGQYANGSQTSSVLPLAFGIAPPEYRQRIFQYLVNKIAAQNSGHIGTGLVGAQWLMRVLSDNGPPDVAYAIAAQSSYPSWGYMISKGATTIWELWNGDTADPSMNSGNHVMLVGDLNIWLHEYILGIAPDPDAPAWKHIIIHPHPVGDLRFARGFYDSPYGRISSDWSAQDGRFTLKLTIPTNATATVYIPARDVTEAGLAVGKSLGVQSKGVHTDAAVFEVTSGSFDFSGNLR
jgi:alpha-L-rhamnosidase